MNRKAFAVVVAALGLAGLGGFLLTPDQLEHPTLLIRLLTNAEPVINPAFSTPALSTVYVIDGEVTVTNAHPIPPSPDPSETNAPVNIEAKVMCPTAIALRWFSAVGHAYQVQWTTNMTNWTSTHTWRIGTGQELEFLGPADGAMGVYRLNVRASPF